MFRESQPDPLSLEDLRKNNIANIQLAAVAAAAPMVVARLAFLFAVVSLWLQMMSWLGLRHYALLCRTSEVRSPPRTC